MNNNRVIKFRIWDININMFLTIKESDSFNLYYFLNRPDDFTVSRFTGLSDKNNKEIYEADIINGKSDYSEIFNQVICYDNIKAAFRLNCGLLLGYTKDIEVIGNVFENPNLLK